MVRHGEADFTKVPWGLKPLAIAMDLCYFRVERTSS